MRGGLLRQQVVQLFVDVETVELVPQRGEREHVVHKDGEWKDGRAQDGGAAR